jgi:hypothetical protein
MSTRTRYVFESQVKLIRQQLRQAAPDLMLELESAELALQNLSPDPDATEYAGYRLAIDAIEAYLDKQNHTVKGIVIAKALANGGWLAKDKRATTNVLDSIRYHLKHPTKRIKAFAGDASVPADAEIGRHGWDESYHRA